MESKIFVQNLIDSPELKVIVYAADTVCNGIVMKLNFLNYIKDVVSKLFPGEPASFFEDPNTRVLRVGVIVGLNNIPLEEVNLNIMFQG